MLVRRSLDLLWHAECTVSPSAAEHAQWGVGVRRLTHAQTSTHDAALSSQMGVVPLTRWYDVFTGMVPRFFSDPHKMVDKLLHDRSVAPSSHHLHCLRIKWTR